jgi:DNA-binding protein H-NS
MFKIGVNQHGSVIAITDGNSAYEADTSLPCYPGPPALVEGKVGSSITFTFYRADYAVMSEAQYNQLDRPRKVAIDASSFDEYCVSRGLSVTTCEGVKTPSVLEKAFENPWLVPLAALGAGAYVAVSMPAAILSAAINSKGKSRSESKNKWYRNECEYIFNETSKQIEKYAELDATVAAIKSEEERKYTERATRRWNKYYKIQELANIDNMTGSEFESAIALLYARKGYQVKKTPSSGDFGVDVIAEKKGRRIVIQAKRVLSRSVWVAL